MDTDPNPGGLFNVQYGTGTYYGSGRIVRALIVSIIECLSFSQRSYSLIQVFTDFSMLPGEFENYGVQAETSLTFCLKGTIITQLQSFFVLLSCLYVHCKAVLVTGTLTSHLCAY
jgi:hypothetical protein